MLSCILALVCGLVVIVVDQISKYFAAANLDLGVSHDFINGLFNIVFVKNRGAAWGMFSGNKILLLGFTIVAIVVCAVIMIKFAYKNKLLFWSLSLILAGGIGNIIDRIFRNGVVVDFIQFDFWQDFPVFNIADCAIVIGGGLMFLYIILDFINDFKKNKTTIKNDEND